MREHFLHEYFRTLIEPGGKQGEGILRGVLVHILLLIDGRHQQTRGLCCGLSDCGSEIICNLFPLSKLPQTRADGAAAVERGTGAVPPPLNCVQYRQYEIQGHSLV